MNADLVKDHFEEGWFKVLKPFIESEDFDNILKFLKSQSEQGKNVFPKSENLFRAFKVTKFEDVKVIMIGQDPYYQPGIADGLAFSCGITGKLQPSLEAIHSEIERTVYNGMNFTDNVCNADLTYLAQQGVLLLNAALTVEQGSPNNEQHHNIWAPFMKYLMDKVFCEYKQDIVFIFLGKVAQKWQSFTMPFGHWDFSVSHPASAKYKGGKWDCEDVFNNTNKLLKQLGHKEIVW